MKYFAILSSELALLRSKVRAVSSSAAGLTPQQGRPCEQRAFPEFSTLTLNVARYFRLFLRNFLHRMHTSYHYDFPLSNKVTQLIFLLVTHNYAIGSLRETIPNSMTVDWHSQ